MLAAYANPYSGASFFSFFSVLAERLFMLLTGRGADAALATDEIQLLVLVGIALSSALVGSFLVLRRMSMLANALSHTILLGIVIAFLLTRGFGIDMHDGFSMNLGTMLIASVVTGILTAYLTQFLTHHIGLQEEASTGLVFTSLFALGIVLVTLLTRNVHIGTEVVMGNVDALSPDDVWFVYYILLGNLALTILFFKEYKLTTFDPGLARSLGFSVIFFNYLIMTQVAMMTISAFRAVGVLLVLAFLTGPVLSARLLTHDLRRMIGTACLLGVLASASGVALSRHLLSYYGLAFSTAGLVVCMIFAIFVLSVLIVEAKNLKSKTTNPNVLSGHQ